MIVFIFRNNVLIAACFNGLGEGHDKNNRIRLTEGLVLPAPQSIMAESKFSVFLVCNYAVSSIKKEQLYGVFQSQAIKVLFPHLFELLIFQEN